MSNYQGKRVARNRRAVILLIAVSAILVGAAAVLIYQKFWLKDLDTPDISQSASSEGLSPSDSSQPAVSGIGIEQPPPYDFSQPAPERESVDNSYFDDAAFIGDSRTNGFMLYSGIGTGENLTSNGLSIFKLSEKKTLTIDEEQYTLLEALALKEYGKVYISLGINELGYNRDKSFYRHYCSAIDEIRRLQPKAVIYIQGLIPLNEAQIEESNGNKFNLSNDHLRVYNDLLRQTAEEKQVVYLDLYAHFADESGILPQEYSNDGVHLKKEPCQRWLEYLKTHTVEFDTLYPDGPPVPEPVEPAEPAQPDTSTADGSAQG